MIVRLKMFTPEDKVPEGLILGSGALKYALEGHDPISGVVAKLGAQGQRMKASKGKSRQLARKWVA
jgi:hypothetical protein